MRRLLRWPLRLLAGLVGLVIVVGVGLAGAGLYFAWRTLPVTEGHFALGADALSAPVTVRHDSNGVPMVEASSWTDAAAAMGWLHARDRLWQMETMRRLGAGRLAEVIGRPAASVDRFMRTLGLERAARAQWDGLDAETRAVLKAYAAGVNAFIADPPGGLPVEFRLLLHTPEPWTPTDSLLWQRLMALQLSGNWHQELLTARLLMRFDAAETAFLLRTEPDAPEPLTTAVRAESLPDAMLAGLAGITPPAVRPRLASNAWAVAPHRSRTHSALLAADPHLGFRAPILWYLARIHLPDLTLEGATVPGVPFMVIGHNGHLAWGLTTTHSDTADLYRERPGPDDGTYLRPEGPVSFQTRNETLRVRFAPDETLTVRETVHGPVLSDLDWGRFDTMRSDNTGEALALASVALRPNDHTPDALLRLNRARSVSEARAALTLWDAPQQNVILADAEGRIAMLSPGRVPMRAPDHDGLTPARGWTGDTDWQGWVARDALPATIDPPTGRVLNANNRVHPVDWPDPLARSFPEPYRARHLAAALVDEVMACPQDFDELQADATSPMAADLLPDMLAAVDAAETDPSHADAANALALLRDWDERVMDRDEPEPLLFAVWMETLTRRLFADELGAVFDTWAGRSRPLPVKRALAGDGDWCDDTGTRNQAETCPDIAAAALDDALGWIADELDGPLDELRWGDVHRVRMAHGLFGFVPGLGSLTAVGGETDGGDFTLNRGTPEGLEARRPLAHVHGAGMRMVVNLAEPARARFALATGQSGNPLSDHYRDRFEGWQDGRLDPIGPAQNGSGEDLRLILTP